MFRKSFVVKVLMIIAVLTIAGQTWAGGEKERMRERLPAIKALKADGVVGENNQGYLTIRKETKMKALVEAENKDRRTIYGDIAKQQGTTPELVGQRRAMQIAKKAVPGTLIQGPKGKWYKR